MSQKITVLSNISALHNITIPYNFLIIDIVIGLVGFLYYFQYFTKTKNNKFQSSPHKGEGEYPPQNNTPFRKQWKKSKTKTIRQKKTSVLGMLKSMRSTSNNSKVSSQSRKKKWKIELLIIHSVNFINYFFHLQSTSCNRGLRIIIC